MLTDHASCGAALGGRREQRGEMIDGADVVAAHGLVQLIGIGAVEVVVGRNRRARRSAAKLSESVAITLSAP